MFLIKIKNTIHGKCILYSSIQGGQTTRFSTRFLYSEKSREKSSRLAEAIPCRARLWCEDVSATTEGVWSIFLAKDFIHKTCVEILLSFKNFSSKQL